MKKLMVPVCIAIMALAAACDPTTLDPITDPNGGSGDSASSTGSGSGGSGGEGAETIGGAGVCDPQVDIDSCEPNVPFAAVDKETAQRALVKWQSEDMTQWTPVRLWRKCNTTHPSLFEVGVTFHEDGRLHVWRREEHEDGYALLRCGEEPADTGSWSLHDTSEMGLPDAYSLEILWDDGGTSKADLAFGAGMVSIRILNEAGEAEELMFL